MAEIGDGAWTQVQHKSEAGGCENKAGVALL